MHGNSEARKSRRLFSFLCIFMKKYNYNHYLTGQRVTDNKISKKALLFPEIEKLQVIGYGILPYSFPDGI